MAKYKVIHMGFDEGYSGVVIRYKGHNYLGAAIYNNDTADKYPMSTFLGCRIAEKRAFIKALKTELKKKEREFQAIWNFLAKTKTEKIPDNQAKEIEHMRKDLQARQRIINNIEKSIQTDIDNYIAFHEKRKASKE